MPTVGGLPQLPVQFESVETLRWIGLSDAATQSAWEDWSAISVSDQMDVSMDLTRYVLIHVDSYEGDVCSVTDMDWNAALDRVGTSDELKAKIMDPQHANIRLTESAAFWVKDSMENRLRWLESSMGVSRPDRGPSPTFATGDGQMFPTRDALPGHTVL